MIKQQLQTNISGQTCSVFRRKDVQSLSHSGKVDLMLLLLSSAEKKWSKTHYYGLLNLIISHFIVTFLSLRSRFLYLQGSSLVLLQSMTSHVWEMVSFFFVFTQSLNWCHLLFQETIYCLACIFFVNLFHHVIARFWPLWKDVFL